MLNILKRFLQLNKYNNLQNNFEDSFLSHPNYPSLYAITDTLTLVGIENIAAKVPKDQFLELPTSFLSIYKDEFILVEKSEQNVLITNENNEREHYTHNTFVSDWDGIVLAIEENLNQTKTSKIDNKFSKYVLLFLLLVIFYFFNNYQGLNLIGIVGFLLSFIGFLLGILIVNEKYGNNEDPLVSKFCSFSENTSCSSVIKSSSNLIAKWFDFSDLPIVFFSTSIVLQLLNEQFLLIVSLVSTISLPLVAYSVWIQKMKIKKWCVLCLAISVIMILLSVIHFSNATIYSVKVVSDFLVIGIIVLAIWVFIKSYLTKNDSLAKENQNLKKFKRTPAIFTSLLKPIGNYDAINSFNRILIGENYKPINISLIVSPSCSHCHTAYKEALELYKRFQDRINITILFNVNPNNPNNNYLDVIFTMLYINKNTPNVMLDALNDWHIVRMKLDQWLVKWNNSIDDFENEKIELLQQYNWCQENNLNFTPVTLVNDMIYPTDYSLKELKYFINEIEEIKQVL